MIIYNQGEIEMKIRDNEYGELISSFLNFWKSKNFSVEQPTSIVNKQWEHALFVNSGLIKYLIKINESGQLANSIATCQPCIKFGTSYSSFREMLSKDGYFTSFRQLSCCANESISLAEFAKNIVEYLSNTVEEFHEKMIFGVSGSNPHLYDILISQGVNESSMVFPDCGAYVLNIDNVIQGQYNSFYFDRGENHPLACKKPICNINCRCGRYLEIGDIGLIRYKNIDFFDHGIGLERLFALQQKKTFIVDIFEFKGLSDIMNKYSDLGLEASNTLTDNFRTIFLLLSRGIVPGNKNQNYLTRFLLRNIFWTLHENKSLDLLEKREMFDEALRHFANYFFLDEEKREYIISEILKEKMKFELLLKKGSRVAIKLFKAGRTNLTADELKNIHETHGIPAHAMEKLIKIQLQ